MSRYQLISTTCDSRESHEHRLGWVLLNICSNFRLPRLRPRLCIRPCIFYYILELRGLCFGRCVQIVCGLVKLLFCSLYPVLRICFVHIIQIVLSQTEFVAQSRCGLTRNRQPQGRSGLQSSDGASIAVNWASSHVQVAIREQDSYREEAVSTEPD
jgi:hypothetical protein